MNDTPRPGHPDRPTPAPPPFDEPKPMREPDPDRLPDEAPNPNPDENKAPPLHAAAPQPEKTTLTDPEPLPPKKARQGRKGLPVLYVLLAGLLLAMLAWWMVEIYGGAIAPDDPAGDPGSVPIEELETEPAG